MRLSSRTTTYLLAFCSLFASTLTQCTMRERESESASMPSLRFKLVKIEETTLDGLDASTWRVPSDLNLTQRSQIIRAYANKNLPLHMRLRLAARNPSLQPVTLANLDYDVLLDEKILGSARISPNLTLPANGLPVEMPLTIDMNTYKFLGDDAMPALRNFSVGLADRRRIPPRFTLRLRPTLLQANGKPGRPSRPVLLDPDSTATSAL